MSDGSKISWLDRPGTKPASWNPIRAARVAHEPDADPGDFATISRIGVHCEHASEGCRHCYAESGWNMRFGTQLPFTRQSRDQVDIFIDEKILTQPLHWTKPRTIFVCSTSDLFGEWVPDEMIDRIIAIAALCPRHTFIVLTKRADRMRAYCNRKNPNGHHPAMDMAALMGATGSYTSECAIDLRLWPLTNLWLGVTAENPEMADKRIPDLFATPAAVRFVSCEPLLGPISIKKWIHEIPTDNDGDRTGHDGGLICNLDWLICGGESGHGARPMHPDWVRALRDQCATAGVPFFFKQWGLWKPGLSGRSLSPDGTSPGPEKWDDPTTAWMSKDTCFSATGDQLDGQRLHAWPEVQP